MSGDGFSVHPEEMRAHSKQVESVGERFGKAADAAQQTSLSTEAFGLIGQFLAMSVIATERQVAEMVSEIKKSAGEVAKAVTDSADTYDQADEQARQPIEQIREV